MVGKTISSYEILEKLGEGGMGVVYRARHTTLDRFAALKFLPPHASSDPVAKARFIREARAASALDHPNICTVHDIGETEGGSLYIVMACYEGTTLKRRIADGPLSVDRALDLTIQIASGVERAHEAGIVHRDLKPANIIVTHRGRAVILDFGLAKLVGGAELTKETTTLGTAAYMSPEQVRGDAIDHRTDVWSLGVVLYELLTGSRPFEGDYEAAVTYAIVQEAPERIRAIRPELPAELERVVEKALAKRVDERYQSAAELKDALESARSNLPVAAPERATALPLWERGTMYAVVVLVAILAVLAVQLWPQAETAPIRSLAVLPLGDYSGGSEEDYFVDGMTEALITELSKLGGLRVISRTSSMRYKDSDMSLPEIARALNVDGVIAGSVLSSDGRVRITAQLIDARTDDHVWAKQFDREMGDVLRLHSDVAQEIAEQVDLSLSDADMARLHEAEPVDPELYELYLRGWQLGSGWNSEGDLLRSIELLQQALARDSTFALAYGAIANTYTHLSHFRYPHDVWPEAEAHARRALEYDEDSAIAHLALGLYELIYARNWSAAEQNFTRAIQLDPNLVEARFYYGWYLAAMGREEAALRELEATRRIDPVSLPIRELREVMFVLLRRYDEAIQDARSTLEFEPDAEAPQIFMGLAYAMKGDSARAVEVLDPVMSRVPHLRDHDASPVWLAWGTYAYAEIGAEEEARRYLRQIVEITEELYVCAYDVGAVYGRLGDVDEAFAWLDRAVEESAPCLPNAQIDPRLDPLRGDPRFKDFLTQAGF